jgi:hypothetical protein
MNNYKEIWMDVIGYEGLYEVSNMGRIKNKKYNGCHITKGTKNAKGYFYIGLTNKGCKTISVHRLVALIFLPNPLNKKTVNHIDGNKSNNFLNNLEWVSHKENMKHGYKNGLINNKGMRSGKAKLTDKQVKEIKENPNNLSQKELSKNYNISQQNISAILNGLTWVDI